MNWDHARHVEVQRLQSTALYLVAALGLGFAAIQPGDPFVKIAASALGLSITLFFWAMTHKLNSAFTNQIWYADRCARRLGIASSDGHHELVAIYAFLGFPRKAPGPYAFIRQINVRLMFHFLYCSFALGWLFLFAYLIVRNAWPQPSL